MKMLQWSARDLLEVRAVTLHSASHGPGSATGFVPEQEFHPLCLFL